MIPTVHAARSLVASEAFAILSGVVFTTPSATSGHWLTLGDVGDDRYA
jgi:hypothetical protein